MFSFLYSFYFIIYYFHCKKVTGGNKGIGFAIVKGLCKKFEGLVYLTARDVSRGEAAVAELKKLGFSPVFHQLDITNKTSIEKFRKHLQEKHGGLDILINNAAIAFKVCTNTTNT